MSLVEDLVRITQEPFGQWLLSFFGDERKLELQKKQLKAYAIRKAVSGVTRTRTIDLSGNALDTTEDDPRSPIEKSKDFFKGMTGWISSAFNAAKSLGMWLWNLPGTLGGWWSKITEGVVALLRFDWNQSDAQIDASIKANNGIAMAAAGEAIGYAVCGAANVGASFLLPKIGPIVAARAAGKFLEEAWEETLGGLRTILTAMSRNVGLIAYKNIRAWIKQLAIFLPPEWADKLLAWGNGKKPWTIAGQVEEFIEAMPSDLAKKFSEGLWEGCLEGFLEAGYIVGNEIDLTLAAMKEQQKGGLERTIEIDLHSFTSVTGGSEPDDGTISDRRDNRLLLRVPQMNAKAALMGAINNHILIAEKDVGMIVGMPAEDYVTATVQRRKLTIVFKGGKADPPWRLTNGRPCRHFTVAIVNPKIGLTWAEIKAACRPFSWGKFEAQAMLKSGRKMVCRGSTSDEAKDALQKFLMLSADEYYAINVIEEAHRNPRVKKDPIRLYPAYATLLTRRPSTDDSGRLDISGDRWDEIPIGFDLWPESEPPNTPPLN